MDRLDKQGMYIQCFVLFDEVVWKIYSREVVQYS